MIEKTYKCDLCQEVVKNPENLVGLYWRDFPLPQWTPRRAEESNRHICINCIKAIKVIVVNEDSNDNP